MVEDKTNEELERIKNGLEDLNYISDESLVISLFLLENLRKPLLLEGNTGVGKTEIAKTFATYLNTDLIRLQCYEGLDVNSAIYEWNYQRQLLAIKIQETLEISVEEKEKHIFNDEYLLERPLLKSIRSNQKAPVLLIDEIDRTDEEFEALLLELLSDFQITIPEIGTIKAQYQPFVILTSNRTRELSDALKRRCLYHWINYPSPEKEIQILKKRIPNISDILATQVVNFIQYLRDLNFSKIPGVAETIDWATCLLALNKDELDEIIVDQTIGSFLKSSEDISKMKSIGINEILAKISGL